METQIEVKGDAKYFHLFLNKPDFKFSSGHFIAYKGFREPLHGHNYHVTIAMKGKLNPDGFVMDFGDVKRYVRAECKKLNQKFLLPMKSDVLTITENGNNMEIVTEDNSFFSFPKNDCCCLPLVHSSAEELARYLVGELISVISLPVLKERGIYEMTIGVSEIEGQEARYTTPVDFSWIVCFRSCHSFLYFHWILDETLILSSDLQFPPLFWNLPDHSMFWNFLSSLLPFIISFICLSVFDNELYSS